MRRRGLLNEIVMKKLFFLLRTAEDLSIGLNSPVEDSQFVLSPHIQGFVILLSEALFLRLKAVFLRLELSRGTTIAA